MQQTRTIVSFVANWLEKQSATTNVEPLKQEPWALNVKSLYMFCILKQLRLALSSRDIAPGKRNVQYKNR